jgi:hypothetical protein
MPFRFNRTAREIAKTPKVSSRMGTRPNPCAILSYRRSVRWSQQYGAQPHPVIFPRRSPVSALNSLAVGAWHLGFFGRALPSGKHGDGRLLWHCSQRAASSAWSSGRRIQLGQVPFSRRVPGIVSSDGLLAGRRAFCTLWSH